VSHADGRSLAVLLARSYAAVLAPLLVALLIASCGQLVTQREVSRIDGQVDVFTAASAEALQLLTDAETGARGYQLTGQRPFLEPYQRGVRLYPVAVARARAADRGARASRLLDAQDAAAARWIDGVGEPAAAGRTPDPVAGKRLFDAVRQRNRDVADYAADRRAAAHRQRARLLAGSLLVAGLLALIALGLAVRAARRATAALTGPVQDLVGTLRQLSGGNFSARVGAGGPRELGLVAGAVNHLGAEAEQMAAREAARRRGDGVVRAVQRTILSAADPRDVLRAATAAVGTGLDVDRAYVRLIEDGRPGAAVALWPAGVTLPPVPVVDSPRPTDPFAVQAVPDVRAEPDLPEPWRAYVLALGVRAYLNAPLRDGTEVLGVLTLQQTRGTRPWTDLDREVAGATGREMALALAHVRTVQKQREAVERLTALDRIREAFVSTVSHELRTPLTSIAGYLELLSDGSAGPITERQRRMLDVVGRNTVRLRALIDDLLTLSSVDAGRLTLESAQLDLRDVVASAVTAMQPVAEAGGLALTSDLPAGPLSVRGDRAGLERVLLNLLSNAVKYTPAGGTVTVTGRAAGPAAAISVADTGIGIPAADQAELFSRFFRASNARDSNVPGTGLGLALVRELVERQDGVVELSSEPGLGTTVTLRLPLGQDRNAGSRVGVR
jgi:two-component system, OmpR family, phosphate regulon sensor histidine kinase PhoR